jgi:hypothetical protein
MQWTFPTSGHLRADLEMPSGRVEVALAPTDEVRVLLEPEGPMSERAMEQIEAAIVTCEDDHLVVKVEKRRLRDAALRLAVLIPDGSLLRCSTASADFTSKGPSAQLFVRTASGDVNVEGPSDTADIATASGDVRIDHILGEGHIRTASGDVAVVSVGGRAIVETASGDVVIGQASSDVKARTASGDVRIQQAVAGDVSINCASGDVTVGVAGGVGTWLDLITVSGDTKCTLPAEGSGEDQAALRISCRTVSGDIRIEPGSAPSGLGWL